MATYIQGVQGYVPPLQPFQPDFNFYSGILSTKQSQYDEARTELSNLYGSLLNAEMLRSDNIAERDAFFKAIKQDIQKLSGVDLSLRQNQSAGRKLFNQLTENDYIVKDIAWTKNLRNAQMAGESLKYCNDPKMCKDKWWEGGDRILQYKANEFATANREETLSFESPEYIPYQDVFQRGLDLLKESGFKFKSEDISPDGRYIITTINGEKAKMPIKNLLGAAMGQDPKMMQYAQGKAYLARKDFGMNNAYRFGSTDAAEAHYYNQAMREAQGKLDSIEKNASRVAGSAERTINSLERNASTAPNGAYLQMLFEEANNVLAVAEGANSTISSAKETLSSAKNNKVGKNALRMLDNSIAAIILNDEFDQATEALAYVNYSQEREADPYALAKYKHSLDLAKIKYQHDLSSEGKKAELLAELQKDAKKRSILDGLMFTTPDPKGNEISKDNSKEVEAALEKTKNDKFVKVGSLVGEAYDLAFNHAAEEGFNGQSTNDLIDLVTNAINGGGGAEAKRMWNNLSDSERVNMIKSQGKKLKSYLTPENSDALIGAYDGVFKPAMQGTDKMTIANRPYWFALMNNPQTALKMADAEMAISVDKISNDAVANMRTEVANGASSSEERELFNMLVNDGRIVSEEEFSKKVLPLISRQVQEKIAEESLNKGVSGGGDVQSGMMTGMMNIPGIMKSLFSTDTKKEYDYYDRVGKTEEVLKKQASKMYSKAVKSFSESFNKYTSSLSTGDASVVGIGSFGSNYVTLSDVNLASGGSNAIITSNTLGYLNQAAMQSDISGDGKIIIDSGGIGSKIPKGSDNNAYQALSAIMQAANLTSFDDKKLDKNPLISITYNKNINGNTGVSAYHIKMRGEGLKDLFPASESKADSYMTNFYKNGITVYIPEGMDNSVLAQQSKKTGFDVAFDYNGGSYSFDNFDKNAVGGSYIKREVESTTGRTFYTINAVVRDPRNGGYLLNQSGRVEDIGQLPSTIYSGAAGVLSDYVQIYYNLLQEGGGQ